MNVSNWSKKLAAYGAASIVLLLAGSGFLKVDPGIADKLVELTQWYLGGQAGVDVILAWKGAKKA